MSGVTSSDHATGSPVEGGLEGVERADGRRAQPAMSVSGVHRPGAVGQQQAHGVIDPIGVALALASALIYAMYVLASSSLLGRTDPLVLAASVSTGAAITFLADAAAHWCSRPSRSSRLSARARRGDASRH